MLTVVAEQDEEVGPRRDKVAQEAGAADELHQGGLRVYWEERGDGKLSEK